MDQATKLVANDRRKVVTALRIVEREERWAGIGDCHLFVDTSLYTVGDTR